MNQTLKFIGLIVSALVFILSMVYATQNQLLIITGILGIIGIFYFIFTLRKTSTNN